MGKEYRTNKKEEYVLKDGLPSSPFYLRKKIRPPEGDLNYLVVQAEYLLDLLG